MASLPTRAGVVPGAQHLWTGGFIAVCASIALSVLSYSALPESIRIHWQLGYGPYYGPEFAPTAVVLAAFPVVLTGILVGSSLLARTFRGDDSFEAVQPYYEWGILAVLAFVLLTQLVIIRLNLG